MKKLIYTISLVTLTFFACEDVLDKRDLNVIDDTLWNRIESAEAYVNNVYVSNMPGLSLADNGGYTDERVSSLESVTNIVYGVYGETDLGAETTFHVNFYAFIRKVNIGIEGVSKSSLPLEQKEKLLGQLYFFRAWRYWQLVRLYGGVPMIMHAQNVYSDELHIRRSTTKESVDIIVEDLKKSIALLPSRWDLPKDQGRITSGAAAALKGRILLNFASPMFNPQNKAERWQAAYDACLQAKQILDAANYGLNSDFSRIFIDNPINNPEAVLYRRYEANTDFSNAWEASIRPFSGGGNGGNGPTWDLVKAFPMKNGKPITDLSSGYDSAYFWQDRDPRLYATVGYNGGTWDMTGRATNVIWTLDQYPGEGRRPVQTGFFCKKASNPSIHVDNVTNGGTAWLEIRYTEVLMNLAECANELGETGEAIGLIGQIRHRAGIESTDNYGIGTDVGKEALRELIMRERFIEFAFENKRYWDLRRRRMYTDDLGPNTPSLNGRKRYGLTVLGRGVWNTQRIAAGEYRGWRRIDTAVYLGHVDINRPGDAANYFAVTLKPLDNLLPGGGQAYINFQERYYFFGIPQSPLDRSPVLQQTKGWIHGTFDPLAE